jgi:hypothetical protein
VFYLATVGATQADDPPGAPSIHKRHVVEDSGAWGERDKPGLSVLEPIVDPDQRGLLIEFGRECQRHTVLREVAGVFLRIEVDLHVLM